MKSAILGIIAGILVLAAVAYATDLVPKEFRLYNVTKRQKVSVKGLPAITVKPTKDTSVYLNGRGTDWTVAAGVEKQFPILRNMTTMVFTNATTAAADPNKLRIMIH